MRLSTSLYAAEPATVDPNQMHWHNNVSSLEKSLKFTEFWTPISETRAESGLHHVLHGLSKTQDRQQVGIDRDQVRIYLRLDSEVN